MRVRIAPSPTGYLHIGTARTALYNWLLARKHKGTFVLRIEDTDVERSSQEMVDVILESLKWLGLDWDEGPYFQSRRVEIYRRYAERLLKEGKAYCCYCTPEELKERREQAIREGRAWKYDRKCLYLSEEEKRKLEKEGRPRAIRFLVPPGKTEFNDLVHGKIEKNHEDIEDFVILKSDGMPTYNFAVVVDDHEMGITHVIRGDDHISNTPKQILIYRALGWEPPLFGHLPLILGEDRSKLSKRHGAVAVLQYKEDGFLPDALVNYLALLGWSPGDNREILSREELIELFSIERVSDRNAIFDRRKLLWMNGEYIKMKSEDELFNGVWEFLKKEELVKDEEKEEKRDYILGFIKLMKERCKTLKDFATLGYYFFRDDFELDPEGIRKHFYPGLKERMEKLLERFEKTEPFTVENIEQALRGLAEELGIKAKELIHPVRLICSGMTFGPGLFELLAHLGKERVIRRIKKRLPELP